MTKSDKRIYAKPVRAAFLLDCSTSKLYDAIKKNEIPSIRIAGMLRVPMAAIESLIAERLEKGDDNDGA